ncbi:hypothetical protein KSP39_PZI006064 [Platanthera zijinensis]|uniref:Ribosome maturation factor RimP N-terminal domain-containing protein n=1 Tax=Platanthera zijinensis TaxID=2320716 RepID=A0AAP0BS40_9ASPA
MELTAGKAQNSLFPCFSLVSLPYTSIRPNPSSYAIPPISSSSYRRHSLICHGRKKNSYPVPVLKELALKEHEVGVTEETEDAAEEVDEETAEEAEIEDLGDDVLVNDNANFEEFPDVDENEDSDPHFGDGAGGGGISLAGTWWDKEALSIAEDVSHSFNHELKIYAFKTSANSSIRLRIENICNKYGSPTMDDIEAFSSAYRLRLDEVESAGIIPKDISLEVSSPGIERVVAVPKDLERFKDRPMYVKYTTMDAETRTIQEADGVFCLISFDLENSHCLWGIADVKINRQKAGKGRPLSKKQRQWRLQTSFESLHLVRVHSDS